MFSRIPIILKILIGFAIAIGGVGYFLYTTYNEARDNTQEMAIVNYHIKLSSAIEELLSDMREIDAGNRGYLIAKDEDFLDMFYHGLDETEQDLNVIEEYLNADSLNHFYADSLSYLVNKKIEFAKRITDLCKEGKFSEAAELIKTEEGRLLMVKIENLVDRIEIQSKGDLNKTTAERLQSSSQTRKYFIRLAYAIFALLVIFYIIIYTDLKKSTAAQKDLKSASRKIQDLYNNAPSGYITVNSNLEILQANQTSLTWLGCSLKEVEKKHLGDFVNPRHREILKKLSESETISNLEIELLGINKMIVVLLDVVTIRNNSGRVQEKRIVLTNISKRKQAEEENRYLARLIDQTSDAIYSTDKNLTIRSWNKGAENMYEFKADEIINKDLSILRSNLSSEERESIIAELAEKGQWSGELIHHRKDGSEINVFTSVTSVRDEKNEVNGYVSVVQDITTRKLYEKKLTNFNNELIEMVNIKTNEIVNILESITDGFISLDKNYNIVYLNKVAAQLLGKDKSLLLGKDLTKSFDKENNSIRTAYKKAFEEQVRIEIEDYYQYLDKWFYGVMYPSPEGVSIFFRDVSQRKQSEEKLVESEKQYRHLFEQNPLPMFVLSVDSMKILDVNKATFNLYGYTYEEFIGTNITSILVDEEKQRCIEYCTNRKSNVENAGVWKHKTKDGKIIFVELLSYDIKFTNTPSLLIISNDITDKIRYEEDLKNSRDELRQLSIHSEKVREEERAHIAREIHDELGQQLTGLKMDLSWLSKRMGNEIPGSKEKTNEMLSIIDDTVKSIRKIASELRPGMLDDLGLNAAIDWQTHEFQKRSGITCIYHSNLKDQTFEKNISIGVFRILQEALTNVARHSNATKVNCDLMSNETEIRLIINDNGKGIVMDDKNGKTLGLLGMKERALMMNGNLTIESRPGGGTKIQLVVPISPEEGYTIHTR